MIRLSSATARPSGVDRPPPCGTRRYSLARPVPVAGLPVTRSRSSRVRGNGVGVGLVAGKPLSGPWSAVRVRRQKRAAPMSARRGLKW